MTKLDQAKRTLLLDALTVHGWGASRAVAKEIGITRVTVYSWIDRYGITPHDVANLRNAKAVA